MNIKEQMAALKAAMEAIVDTAKAAARDLTVEESTDIETKAAEYTALKDRLTKAEKAASLLADLAEPVGTGGDEPEDARRTEFLPGDFGKAFVASDAYRGFRKAHPSGIGNETPVNIGAKLGPMSGLFKATIGIDSDASGFVNPQRLAPVDYTGPEDITLLDLISRGTMTGNMVEYVQIVSVTEGAAIVEPGDLKPLSDFATTLADAKAYTYADGFDITNQALSDDGFVASYIQARLPRHLRREVQRVLLEGSGLNGEPQGILSTTGVQNQSPEGTDVLDTLAAAIEKVENADGTATAVAMTVRDAWALQRLRDAQGRFYGNGPWAQGPLTVWGVPVVKVRQLTTGRSVVGDFRTVTLLDREGVSVVAFNQHADYARRNKTYVRGELRAAQAIFEPAKLVVVDLGSGESASS